MSTGRKTLLTLLLAGVLGALAMAGSPSPALAGPGCSDGCTTGRSCNLDSYCVQPLCVATLDTLKTCLGTFKTQ